MTSWYVHGQPVQFPAGGRGGYGWPLLLAVLAAALGFVAFVVAAHRVWVRRRRRRLAGPGLPYDGKGCMKPAMEDRWFDLAARYDEQTAPEPAYPRRPQ